MASDLKNTTTTDDDGTAFWYLSGFTKALVQNHGYFHETTTKVHQTLRRERIHFPSVVS